MSRPGPPNPWRAEQLDQAIKAEANRVRLFGLDTLAQGLRYLSRRLTKQA